MLNSGAGQEVTYTDTVGPAWYWMADRESYSRESAGLSSHSFLAPLLKGDHPQWPVPSGPEHAEESLTDSVTGCSMPSARRKGVRIGAAHW